MNIELFVLNVLIPFIVGLFGVTAFCKYKNSKTIDVLFFLALAFGVYTSTILYIILNK